MTLPKRRKKRTDPMYMRLPQQTRTEKIQDRALRYCGTIVIAPLLIGGLAYAIYKVLT